MKTETLTTAPHWDHANPWRETIVYVPLELLAACVAGGTIRSGGETVPYTVAFLLQHWARFGAKLDGYILPQADGAHSIGVRYGAGGSEYLSPHNANPDVTLWLLSQYGRDA